MTEHPHQKSEIPQFYSHHYYHHQPTKRPLTSPNNTVQYSFQNANLDATTTTCGVGYPTTKATQHHQYDELTESNLRKNAQIVLNNLNRNALKTYLYEKLNNNNPNFANRIMSSPESDCNSNPHIGGVPLGCSIASSQDFTHDNSDYQWFLDYGYRDGVTHNSILSSLSASYNGIGELSYYEDLAKNIDANLAEVDIESFRAEDINTLLTYRKDNTKTRQQETDLDNSICKSKQLFSPVKESVLSVDSLDLDCYADDADIILTCQANKDNYTIAFEGSAVYSDESFYDGHPDIYGKMKQNSINSNVIDDIVKRKALEVSMSRSDTGFTTWSKLKKVSASQLQRYPSGNNNTSINVTLHTPHCFVRKSSSLPNLQINPNNQLHVSQAISTSTVDSYGKMRTLLPMCPMPVQSSISESESPAPLQNSSSSNEPQPNPPSFNLVKLFIKQKSSSTDTCMDVSSGCWPSDSNSSVDQRQRKKSMNDSGKGSALSRHDEDNENDFQYDSLDVPTNAAGDTVGHKPSSRSNDLYREVFDSPSHRNNYKECNLNIRNYPRLTNVNNNNSIEKDSLKETNRSLSDTSRTSENITQLYTTARRPPPMETITRSIQTSFMQPAPVESSIKVVSPSFLAQLNLGSKLGGAAAAGVNRSSSVAVAPVYVIYPNYALPDLGFVNTHQSDIILSPIGYKDIMPSTKKQRPISLATDASEIKGKDYKHVIDWKSLVPLLPIEYRKLLKHIPEVGVFSSDAATSQRPMFCMSPPLRRNRPISCDCSSICTLSSGSSQPPSSGFRGSSTLLTDSDLETATTKDPLQNMYVYQYENTRMENDNLTSAERPPSGRTVVPRGILRRNSNNGKIGKSKRNSMFEEDTASTPHTADKRRSLQEPYYAADAHNNVEDYLTEINGHHHHHHHHDSKSKRLTNSRVSSYRQYYPDIQDFNETNKMNKANLNYIMELNEEANRRLGLGKKETDVEAARVRAENFLSNVPKSDLKYYAEIANILESIENCTEAYDRKKLRNEVSRALSQQKRVSFIQRPPAPGENGNGTQLLAAPGGRDFKTPPNSPNISIAALRMEQKNKKSELEKQEKIQSNRFKRLQIQWELLSKEGAELEKELVVKETRSGGSTPTSANGDAKLKSKIPRPVSYPATKHTVPSATSKALQSPSRMATPKKYSVATTATVNASAAPASRPRTPSKPHNTPKKTAPIQSNRMSSRCTR